MIALPPTINEPRPLEISNQLSDLAWHGLVADSRINKFHLAEGDISTEPHVVIIADPPEVRQVGIAQNQYHL